MGRALSSLGLADLRSRYLERRASPVDVVEQVLAAIGDDPHCAWISRVSTDALFSQARALAERDPASLPLFGVPFAIKDNIDLAGVPTTAGCPAFAYRPGTSAFVVERLVAAGAIAIGKTNLDQFATGLNGTRSPYGACLNAIDPRYVSGGSSSGSAVAVALGHVSFALGTDTAGSGRVPAAFNDLVGVKPTRGLLSTRGVVPACRSLDTVSIFARSGSDAQQVLAAASVFDPEDPYARPAQPRRSHFGRTERFWVGVPSTEQLEFFGDREAATLFAAACDRIEAVGGEVSRIDLAPFLEAARLLYEGPWVAERWASLGEFITVQPEAVLPVTRAILEAGRRFSAAELFSAQHRLAELKREAEATFARIDVLLLPTAPTIHTVDAMLADPVRLNSQFGYYTNFVNLLDLAAVAVPAGFRAGGLPFGVTFCAPAHQDAPLLELAQRWEAAAADRSLNTASEARPSESGPRAPADGWLRLAVCGAHLSGEPLNGELVSRGAHLVTRTTTAPCYRLLALPGGRTPRPGLVHDAKAGRQIEVEVWELPAAAVGSFLAGIPAPLGLGRTQLADGSEVTGFICEPKGLADAHDISHYGGWRAYRRAMASQS